MNRASALLLPLVLPAAAALALAAAASAQDRVQLLDGSALNGQVASATFDAVVVKTRDGEQKLDGRQVLGIEFGALPEALRGALDYLEAHDYANAVNLFDAAAGSGGAWWVEPYARLGKARALLGWAALDSGRASEAADAFAQWVGAWPESWFAVEARRGRARATALAGQVDEASRQLEELASYAFEKNLGKHVELAARLDRAEALLQGGQVQVAEQRLRDLVKEVETALGADPPAGLARHLRQLRARSEIDLGEAIARKSGDAAARPYWEGLLRDRAAGPEVRAAAQIGLARAARGEGKAREAQILLARVVATTPAANPALARALFELGEVTRELGDTPAPGAAYFERLVAEFPHTTWAARARQKLGG